MKHIFIACGHTEDAPLTELVEEARSLERILRPLADRGIVSLNSNRAANVDDIFQLFSREEIHIFHYSGHADEDSLYLEEAGDIKGIASLMGLQQKEMGSNNPLQFVFLNGCSSKGQVEELYKAGIAAVIATSRPIGDLRARTFAEKFYETWAMEGKSLSSAFEEAKSRMLAIKSTSEFRTIIFREEEEEEGDFHTEVPWGLYLNPQLEDSKQILDWKLNELPQLPPMILSQVKAHSGQSLRELVMTFQRSDRKIQEEIRKQRKDPLMVLIERLPWIVGTHLRRLFAVEDQASMLEAGLPRLKELIVAYQELTRFISYLTLSMTWDAMEEGFEVPEFDFPLLPEAGEVKDTDFVQRSRKYFAYLDAIDNKDPLELEAKISSFLKAISNPEELGAAYNFMEPLKQALYEGEEALNSLLASRQEGGDLSSLVLKAEAMYAAFLKNCLFLCNYKLLTVRSIVVDKLRYLNEERPYSHYTMSLHAAFSELSTSLIGRGTPTDNYCLLLTWAGERGEDLDYALNLSPFYLDRSSFLGKGTDNYPAVFAIDHVKEGSSGKEYIYKYIDVDINHNYAFEADNSLTIDSMGAIFPDHVEVDFESLQKFEQVHRQLSILEQEIPHQS